jgi:hypothetical protein
MSFSRWQKLMAARMPRAVPPAAPIRFAVVTESFRNARSGECEPRIETDPTSPA